MDATQLRDRLRASAPARAAEPPVPVAPAGVPAARSARTLHVAGGVAADLAPLRDLPVTPAPLALPTQRTGPQATGVVWLQKAAVAPAPPRRRREAATPTRPAPARRSPSRALARFGVPLLAVVPAGALEPTVGWTPAALLGVGLLCTTAGAQGLRAAARR